MEPVTDNKTIVVMSSHTPSLFWFRMDMMLEFIRRGYSVYAFGNEEESKWAATFRDKGITYEQIPVRRNGLNPLQDKKTMDSITEKLKRIRPDKIFTYQAKTVIYGSMAARKAGISDCYPLIAGMGAVFINNDIKSRLIRVVMTALYRIGMKKCPLVFFQNDDDLRIFRENGIIRNQKIAMINGSGVNTEKFTMMPLPGTPAFLCICRLIAVKGIYEYLEACRRIKAEYPNVRCLLVGPYDTNPSALKPEDLEPYISDGVIEYFGEQEDVRPYIGQSSVYILPAYREGTPKTNLEAMACGRAVITTDAPGCRETVVDGENGFLVPVKDVNSIYEKMKYFVENPDVIETMGRKGRQMVEDRFDVNRVNAEICKAMQLN